MNLVVLIKDRNGHPREAIPVRAIPLLTNWNFFSPDVVAQTLADDEGLRGFISGELQAFYLENDQVKPLKRGWWEGDAVRALRGLGEKIEHSGLPREAGYQRWREESLPLLPAGVFVWKADIERFHARNWDGRFRILASSVPTEVDGNGVNTPISRAHGAFINDGLTALEKWRELDFTTYIRPAMRAVILEGMPDNQAETLVAATPLESRPPDRAKAERKAGMLEMLERMKSIEYHDNEDALEHELDDAEASTAPVVAASASGGELDFTLLATRERLIAAFGTFTKMDKSWFEKLEHTHALYAARKVTGQGGRGHIIEPLFCPYEVMQWLIDPKRRKGKKMSAETGWRMLKAHFPKVHAAYEIGDPNNTD